MSAPRCLNLHAVRGGRARVSQLRRALHNRQLPQFVPKFCRILQTIALSISTSCAVRAAVLHLGVHTTAAASSRLGQFERAASSVHDRPRALAHLVILTGNGAAQKLLEIMTEKSVAAFGVLAELIAKPRGPLVLLQLRTPLAASEQSPSRCKAGETRHIYLHTM
jgi:hypothetical protein